jgi:hypothetical protein
MSRADKFLEDLQELEESIQLGSYSGISRTFKPGQDKTKPVKPSAHKQQQKRPEQKLVLDREKPKDDKLLTLDKTSMKEKPDTSKEKHPDKVELSRKRQGQGSDSQSSSQKI